VQTAKRISFDLKPDSLFCAYELSTFSIKNRDFFQKLLSKNVVGLILHKIEHFVFDEELLGAFKLFKLFSQRIKFLQIETQNCPILEVCLLSLERDHKCEEINREVLCILSNILLNYNNYRKIFIDNDGFNVIKKKVYMFDEEVLSLCRNFLYSSTFQEKEAFIREIPVKYVHSVFKTQKLNNLDKIFNILRNLFCCNENELVKLLKHFDIEGFPSKLVYILMQYYDFFISCEFVYKEIILNIIYTLVNLCILPNKEKSCILDLEFAKAINMNDREINLALIWLFINITWNVTEDELVQKIREKNLTIWIDMIEEADEVIREKKGTLFDNLAKLSSLK
ncbi:putative Armadillo-type fold protein, partial [Trachipleistophora hominis]